MSIPSPILDAETAVTPAPKPTEPIINGMTKQIVNETIYICKDWNILKEYLIIEEVEVVTIMMSLFDNEQMMKTYLEGYGKHFRS